MKIRFIFHAVGKTKKRLAKKPPEKLKENGRDFLFFSPFFFYSFGKVKNSELSLWFV